MCSFNSFFCFCFFRIPYFNGRIFGSNVQEMCKKIYIKACMVFGQKSCLKSVKKNCGDGKSFFCFFDFCPLTFDSGLFGLKTGYLGKTFNPKYPEISKEKIFEKKKRRVFLIMLFGQNATPNTMVNRSKSLYRKSLI